MKIYARVKENLRFGRQCAWEEVKQEVRQMNRQRLVFVNGLVDNAYAYDIIYVFEK